MANGDLSSLNFVLFSCSFACGCSELVNAVSNLDAVCRRKGVVNRGRWSGVRERPDPGERVDVVLFFLQITGRWGGECC